MSQLESIFEGDSAAKIDYVMTYGYDYSVAAKKGTPILAADIAKIYFYIKTLATDASAWLAFTDDDEEEIEWLDEAQGRIRIHLGEETAGQAGDNQRYELRVRFADGKLLTVDHGIINILQSLVDQPSSSSVSPSVSPSPSE